MYARKAAVYGLLIDGGAFAIFRLDLRRAFTVSRGLIFW